LLADDHAGYVLGCDGNRQATTPNLDRFASQGTRFAANFCNSPVCTPSRQSFFTGQMPHSAGVTVLRTALADDKPTVAKQLRAAGYNTAVFGKMHFNVPGRPGLHGFDYPMTEREVTRAWMQDTTPRPIPPDIRTKPPWHPFKDPARIWLNAEELPYPRYLPDMRSTFQLHHAFQYLEAHKEKPFAMWFSLMEPHSPYDFPVEYRGRFKPSKFQPPRVGSEDAWQIPLIFRDLSDDEKRGIAASYYTSVSFVDHNIGLILDKLHELGLDDNTLVVYMADHGYLLGQHGRFEKHCCYEPALRVPLMMRWPGHIRQGVVTDMTESVDVPHTILDLMDADPLPVRHGHSLRPYLEKGRRETPRDHIFSEYLENEEACIRTERYKFIHCSGKRARKDGYATDNPTPGRYIRLYDRQSDPGEFTDVAREHPELVKKFQGLMLARFRATHPEAVQEPKHAGTDDLLDWYLRPRDAQ
jgi:choline-sulfatase